MARRRAGWLSLLGAGLLAAGCLNPRPEEDPSDGVPPGDGEPTATAGAAGAAAEPSGPGGAAGAGGSGFGAGGSGSEPPSQSVDDPPDAGADAGPDAGATTAPKTDAGAPDAGPP